MGVTGDKSHLKHLGGSFLKGQWIMTTVPFWTKVSSSRQIIFSMQKITLSIDFCTIIHFCESYYCTNWLTAIYKNPRFMILHHPCLATPLELWKPEISCPSFGFSMRNMATSNKMGSHPTAREGWGNKVLLVKVLWWVTGLAFFLSAFFLSKWLNLPYELKKKTSRKLDHVPFQDV